MSGFGGTAAGLSRTVEMEGGERTMLCGGWMVTMPPTRDG